MNNYNQIADTLNAQLRRCEKGSTLTAGIVLSIETLADEFQKSDPSFDRLQFDFRSKRHTEFSDGGRALQARETYMMA